MASRLSRFLNQPYPDADDLRSILRSAFMSGLVVFLVLFLFKPFGLHRLGDKLWIYCLQFAGITSAISLFFDLTIRFVFGIRRDRPEWTLWKWLLAISVLILLIALGNYAFIIQRLGGDFSLEQFLWALYTTILIGIFPITIFGTANMVRLLKTNQAIAAGFHPVEKMTETVNMVELPVNKSLKVFPVDASAILYVEAMQNYVNICYINDEGVQTEILRNTMAAIEDTLSSTSVTRCHRSFLVNKDVIESVRGNAQGLRLKLIGLEDAEVPVSRKYLPDFRN